MRLNQSPLAYSSQTVPLQRWSFPGRPTSSDYKSFNIGDEWWSSDHMEWWKLSDRTSTSGTWVMIGGATAAALNFLPDSGTSPVNADGSNNLTIAGGTGITTVGSSATLTFNADTDVATSYVCDTGTATPSSNVLNVVGGISVSTSGSGDTLTISSAGPSVLTWEEVTSTTFSLSTNMGYIINTGTLCTLTLPTTIAAGQVIEIVGKGAGGWTLAQSAGQSVTFLTTATSIGAGGSITPDEVRATMGLVCITDDTDFAVRWSLGNFTVV